jgi:hypothetical protein
MEVEINCIVGNIQGQPQSLRQAHFLNLHFVGFNEISFVQILDTYHYHSLIVHQNSNASFAQISPFIWSYHVLEPALF